MATGFRAITFRIFLQDFVESSGQWAVGRKAIGIGIGTGIEKTIPILISMPIPSNVC
jgi:hypothetical protein